MKLTHCFFALLLSIIVSFPSMSHPLGDLLSFGDDLYWVYVCPIDSSSHQACIMKRNKDGAISEWKRSSYGGSDWLLSRSVDNQFYFIERYYNHSLESHMARLYKMERGKQQLITDWYKDDFRIGESGFAVLENNEIVFALRGKLKVKKLDGEIKDWKKFNARVRKLRVLKDGSMLLLQENDITQINTNGEVIAQWKNIIEKQQGPKPLMGNRILDADYDEGELIIAYWGNRKFESISKTGKRKTLKQYDVNGPWLPHSVSYHHSNAYGLASQLNGQNPDDIYPELSAFHSGKEKLLWTKE